tara:strand:- start:571 stop:771 length:201 start_codon:yes stop_codon:yes gene_type:complete
LGINKWNDHLPYFPKVATNEEVESFEWTNGGAYLDPHENYVANLTTVEFSTKSYGARLPVSYCPAS